MLPLLHCFHCFADRPVEGHGINEYLGKTICIESPFSGGAYERSSGYSLALLMGFLILWAFLSP